MRWIVPALAVALATGLAGWNTSRERDERPSALYARAIWGTTLVEAVPEPGQPSVQGSGFYVAPHLMLTCAHVTGLNRRCRVYQDVSRADSIVQGRVLYADTLADIAVVYTDTVSAALALRLDAPDIGEPVVAIGNPHGYMGSLSAGVISQLRTDRDRNVGLVQSTSAVEAGSSGGPLIDRHGRVVGMIASTSDENAYAFAIDVASLRRALGKVGRALETRPNEPQRVLPNLVVDTGWYALDFGDEDLAVLAEARDPGDFAAEELPEAAQGSILIAPLFALWMVLWSRQWRLNRMARVRSADAAIDALRAQAFLPEALLAAEHRERAQSPPLRRPASRSPARAPWRTWPARRA